MKKNLTKLAIALLLLFTYSFASAQNWPQIGNTSLGDPYSSEGGVTVFGNSTAAPAQEESIVNFEATTSSYSLIVNGNHRLGRISFKMPNCGDYDLTELGANIKSTSAAGNIKLAMYNFANNLIYETGSISVTGGLDEYVFVDVTPGTLTLLKDTSYYVAVIGDAVIYVDADENAATLNTGVATNLESVTRTMNQPGSVTYPNFPDPATTEQVSYRAVALVVKGNNMTLAPTVLTTTLSAITQTTASSGGDVTTDGGSAITARGVCWNTAGSPTITDSKTTDGTSTGVFSSSLTTLSPSTTYYVRSYATNCAGTKYGSEEVFTTAATTPTITVDSSSITSFTSCSGTASTEQTMTVSGNDLTADAVVTAPSDFEVSLTSGSGFASSVTIPATTGTLSITTVYVRVTNLATSGAISGTLTMASTGATDQTVNLSGTVDSTCTPTPCNAGVSWTSQTSATEANQWTSVTYGNGLFVAVSLDGTNRVMSSPDGITWTSQTEAEANEWMSVTYGNGLFVAVASSGTNPVMTSPDGITWTARTAVQGNGWRSITYGNGLFVAVAVSGTNRVMTSPDGITWTARAVEANMWSSVTYGGGKFVAVGLIGIHRVMTSLDGITWIQQTATEANMWSSVTYGNGLFVAVSLNGTNRVMTSSDGITWAAQAAVEAKSWTTVTYGNGMFVALAGNGTGNRVMTSLDGITWTAAQNASVENTWSSVTYGNDQFVAVATVGTNLVMTSGCSTVVATPTITVDSTSILSFTSCSGTASAEQIITVSGNDLTADVVVTAPTDFEVSLTSGAGFASSVTIPATAGTLSTTTVYVRVTNLATSGAKSGNLTVTSTDATLQSIVVSGTINENPILSVTETTYVFPLNEVITPIAIQNTVSGGENFASYASATAGTLNGVNFIVSDLPDAYNEFLSLNNTDWNSVGDKQGIIYDVSFTFTITFDSPVTNLNFYLFYFRGSTVNGYASYTFNHPFTVTHGLTGLPINENTLDVSSTVFARGIIQFTEPVTSLTVTGGGTGSSQPSGGQGFTMSSASANTYSVSPALPEGLSLDTATGAITGTPTVSSSATDYTITGTTADGCSDSLDLSVKVETTLGTATFDAKNFTYYPNPTTGILNMSYSNKISEVIVHNMLGQVVLTKKGHNFDMQLDMSHLTAATYFVKIVAEGITKTIKVLKTE